ncbi:MAG: inorganic phosphate transporter [Gemmatimonadetes bacterium]|nr:inorganic phosphate transporter [Gemmatimonadota bacterium]
MAGVAFANGANDASKGVATLVGAGLGSPGRALRWGTAATVAGALAAGLVSQGLVALFSGNGVLDAPPEGWMFPAAVAAGALGWLAIATRIGLPVSTTHALVGGLVGVGLAAGGFAGIGWTTVAGKVALPLAFSPVVSLGLVAVVAPPVTRAFGRLNRYCVCLEQQEFAFALARGPSVPAARELKLLAGADCPPRVLTRLNALDAVHWASAGFASFARALNDAPKVMALGLAGGAAVGLSGSSLIVLVALAMGVGSHLAGGRVTDTLAQKVTPIPADHGLAANLVTAALVGIASLVAAPVSTTHVSTGAIVGIGLRRRDVHWRIVREFLLAWVVTVPVAAVLAGSVYAMMAR